MTWVLVFYLVGQGAGSGGGPAVADFVNEAGCHSAASEIKKTFGGRYQGHICVPKFTRHPQ